MEDFLKGVFGIITAIFTALLIIQITHRRKKDKEMEELISQKADKTEISKKADKEYVDKQLVDMKDSIRLSTERDAEIHNGIYKLMNSMDRKLDILIQKDGETK